jgi:hypothetical protein
VGDCGGDVSVKGEERCHKKKVGGLRGDVINARIAGGCDKGARDRHVSNQRAETSWRAFLTNRAGGGINELGRKLRERCMGVGEARGSFLND